MGGYGGGSGMGLGLGQGQGLTPRGLNPAAQGFVANAPRTSLPLPQQVLGQMQGGGQAFNPGAQGFRQGSPGLLQMVCSGPHITPGWPLQTT